MTAKKPSLSFTVTNKELERVLSKMVGVTRGGSKTVIPVLTHVLLETWGETSVRVTGTDLDIYVRMDMEADEIVPGKFCVPADKLYSLAKSLPSESLSLSLEDNGRLLVKADRATYRLAGLDAELFPEVPPPAKSPIRISAVVLQALLDNVQFAATRETGRFALQAVHMLIVPESYRAEASDGHTMSRSEYAPAALEAAIKDGGEVLELLIPLPVVAELSKFLGSAAGIAPDVLVSQDDNHICFDVAGDVLISRRLAGQFPNCQMILDSFLTGKDKTWVASVVAAKDLNGMVDRVAILGETGGGTVASNKKVVFDFQPGELTISAESEASGSGIETLAMEYDGPAVKMGLQNNYVSRYLKHMGAANVEMSVAGGEFPLFFRPGQSADYRADRTKGYHNVYLLMPMRI